MQLLNQNEIEIINGAGTTCYCIKPKCFGCLTGCFAPPCCSTISISKQESQDKCASFCCIKLEAQMYQYKENGSKSPSISCEGYPQPSDFDMEYIM